MPHHMERTQFLTVFPALLPKKDLYACKYLRKDCLRFMMKRLPFSVLFLLVSSIFETCAASGEGKLVDSRSKKSKLKDTLNGMHMRVSLYQQYPLMQPWRQTNGSYATEGFFSDIIDMIAEYFNMTYNYVLVDPNKWVSDGNFKSLMNQLLNNETDFAPYPFPRNIEYSEKMYMGTSIAIVSYAFAQPFPLEESRLTAPVRPFSVEVWLLFIFSTFGFIIAMTLVILYIWDEPENPSIGEIAYQCWEYALTILLAQGNSSPSSKKLSLRIMVGLWLLMMVVVINAYTGTLTSFLTVPKLEPTVDTFEQLVARNKKMITEKGAYLDEMILNATSGVYKDIGDELRKNPHLLMTNYAIVMNYIMERGHIYCGPDMVARRMIWAIQKDYNAGDKCLATLGKKTVPLSTDSSLAMRKEWPFNKIIDQTFIQYMWDSGYVFNIYRKYFPLVEKCDLNRQQGDQSSFDGFDLKSFSSIFIALIAGLGLSFVVFLLEMIIGCMQEKRNKANN